MDLCWLLTLLLLLTNSFCRCDSKKQNIVFIVADDLGWNDVSFHGSEDIRTPNLDVLANSGVVLHRYYSHPVCTPSRAALMTGKYAFRTGMQGYPLTNSEARGLPLSEKIMPQYLKELGYSTHLVGKWHLGHQKYSQLPTFRGFDSHYGHRIGYLDYYEYTCEENWPELGPVSGFALFRNVTPDWNAADYITDLYTKEALKIIKTHNKEKPLFLMVCHNAPHSGNDAANLQAPPEEVRNQRRIILPGRRIYAAMVKKLDDSVGEIVTALSERGMLQNSIIVFVSDNGGPATSTKQIPKNWSSNKPFRGMKMTPWEGGMRLPAAIWSMDIVKRKTSNLWCGFMHSVDWLPTILGAIGNGLCSSEVPDIDGINLWEKIVQNGESDRNEIVEIDDLSGFGAIIYGDFKLVTFSNESVSEEYYGSEYVRMNGRASCYRNTLQKSKTYAALKTLDINLNTGSFDVKKTAKVHCGDKEVTECHSSNGNACLFNVMEDPCERVDLSIEKPDVVRDLRRRLRDWMDKTIPRKEVFRDPKGLPEKFNYTWASWQEPSEIYKYQH